MAVPVRRSFGVRHMARMCKDYIQPCSYQKMLHLRHLYGSPANCVPRIFAPASKVNPTNFRRDESFSMPPFCRQFTKTIRSEELCPVTSVAMRQYLLKQQIVFEQGYTCFRLDCLLCPHTRKGGSRIGKLYINLVTGMFLCHKCRVCGTWQEFQDYVAILRKQRTLDGNQLIIKTAPDWLASQDDLKKVQKLLDTSTPVESLTKDEYQLLQRKCGVENLELSTAQKYGLRRDSSGSLLIPVFGVDGSVAGFRLLSNREESTQPQESVAPRRAGNLLFGCQKISPSQREVVLTAFPVDAMLINQELNISALSLPKGFTTLPLEALPFLEQFDRIVLWLGNTVQAWDASRTFSRKLGEERCYFIRPKESNPRPYEALQNGLSLSSILNEAHPIGHKSITSFSVLREDVLTELSHVEQVAGVKWHRFPHLNRLLKGHRRGELTVMTGPTGSGKTTFMSEYSLDLCMQGVSTLWGSFEIKNVRLAKMMITQFSELPLDRHLDQFDLWADKFEQLPLYFMMFHGQETIKNVLEILHDLIKSYRIVHDLVRAYMGFQYGYSLPQKIISKKIQAMSHATYVHDIRHVVVDNMQFMMGVQEGSSTFDRYWRQDNIIASFRKFATINNVHVSLVIHPRKERDVDELNNMSIFGSAKASQEADNILILQDKQFTNMRGKKYIQITKNRYDGDLGIVPLEFNKDNLSFSVRHKIKKATKSAKKPQDPSTRENFTFEGERESL